LRQYNRQRDPCKTAEKDHANDHGRGRIKLTLPELLDTLTPGDEVILTRNLQPVAKLVSETAKPAPKPRPGPGLGKGMITFISPDFDAPLDCMREYME
jgi:antitoxin (DNA-binding transcriptional repressor) of toxin-antitoxin stability system